MAESIITCTIFGLVALFMMGIGVSQLKSKTPVAFYSGEKPPKAEELTDVHAWNVKHGRMWLMYGVIIIISCVIGYLMGDTIWCLIPFCGGVIIPVVFMIWYHQKLVKRYRR